MSLLEKIWVDKMYICDKEIENNVYMYFQLKLVNVCVCVCVCVCEREREREREIFIPITS